MRGLSLLALASTTLAWSRNPQHVNKRHLLEKARPATHLDTRSAPPTYGSSNGSYIPDVDFDIGESYAGLLPISDKANASELYFWFVPSANELAGDEILIWLNGGPGCSSLEGFLQENGPFLWQYGTYKPVKNNWSWSNLTNVVWVEQPAGTGFSHVGSDGAPKNEVEVAAQFLGWFKNFVDTFALYVSGTECFQGAANS
jgi:carboxypeptidase D